MLKFAVQPGAAGGTPSHSVSATHSHESDNDHSHSEHGKGSDAEKRGHEHDCAICSARRLVISREKSLVRRARSRSRDRLQRPHSSRTDSECQETVDESARDTDTTECTQNDKKSGNRQADSNSTEGEASISSRGRPRLRVLKKAKSFGSQKSMERLCDETSTTSSSDGDSMRGGKAERPRSNSRGRKRSTTERPFSGTASSNDTRRSRSHSRSRKRSTASIDDLKRKDSTEGGSRRTRSTSRGRIFTRQSSVVSDTELMHKTSSESEGETVSMPRTGGHLDLRTINPESKYRESCRIDTRRRGSTQNTGGNPLRKQQKVLKEKDSSEKSEIRRQSDPEEMLRVKSAVSLDRRCSLPETDDLTCASYNMPRGGSVVRRATIRKCRSEMDGFMSDGKSSTCSSDAESTSSGRQSTSSELDDMAKKIIYECDEDSASCFSADGSCTSDNGALSLSSNRSVTPNMTCQAPSSSGETPTSPVSPVDENSNSLSDALSTRSPSGDVSCSAYCSDSGVSCFERINPIASQTKAAVVKTGEKTVARVRRLNTKARRSVAAGGTGHHREGARFPKEDNSCHFNSKELEMLIVSSCFGTSKCLESIDTSDYESEPGSESQESHTDSDCQSQPKRLSFEDVTSERSQRSKKMPRTTVASRLAGGGSYSPVKASQERYRSELDKMPRADFSYRAVMQHAHKALSSVELTTKQGEAIYLHRKELIILREQSPIWVMAYSKVSNRIGFVPAVYVNVRLEDLI